MRSRITEAQLNELVDRINEQAGTPAQPYAEGAPQVGNYHLSFAYGGVSLHQMYASGGVTDVFNRGHMTKRELYNLMGVCTPKEAVREPVRWQPLRPWDEHPQHSRYDWFQEVAADNTRMGYAQWVNHQRGEKA